MKETCMKIAAVTNDGTSISAHFGKARSYAVMTVEDGAITHREMRDKDKCSHSHHDHDHHDQPSGVVATVGTGQAAPAPPRDTHAVAVEAIADCDVVLSRGMGRGMYTNLARANIRPVLTDMADIDKAVAAYLAGSLTEHPELVH
jgi:predicted Fe-Mo cluster-binding NifX family protein